MGVFCLLNRIGFLLLCQSGTSEIPIFLQRLRPELNTIHEKNNFIRILGCGNQLGGLKRCHRLTGACCVPYISAALVVTLPFYLGNLVRNRICSIVLVTAHDLKNTVRIIRNSIKANQLMSHRDRKQCRPDLLPIIYRLIVKICPMKIEILVKFALRTGVGKIKCLIRIHRDKYLYKGKKTGKDSLPGIFFYLISCL